MATVEQNIQTSVRFNELINQDKSLQFLNDFLAPNHIWHDSSTPNSPTGIEGTRMFLHTYVTAFLILSSPSKTPLAPATRFVHVGLPRAQTQVHLTAIHPRVGVFASKELRSIALMTQAKSSRLGTVGIRMAFLCNLAWLPKKVKNRAPKHVANSNLVYSKLQGRSATPEGANPR